MTPTRYQKWFQKLFFFCKNLKISCSLDHAILFKFHQHIVQILFNEWMYWETLDSQFQHQQLSHKESLTSTWLNLLQKLMFRKVTNVIIADSDIGSL